MGVEGKRPPDLSGKVAFFPLERKPDKVTVQPAAIMAISSEKVLPTHVAEPFSSL